MVNFTITVFIGLAAGLAPFYSQQASVYALIALCLISVGKENA